MAQRIKHPRIRREVTELALLFEISQLLDGSAPLHDEMGAVLKAIARNTGMIRGTITLLNRKTGEISTEVAHGLSASQRERGRYFPGEGVVGGVVQQGRPVAIPRVSEVRGTWMLTASEPAANSARHSTRRMPSALSRPSGT